MPEAIAVADSGPLISLAGINQFNLLPQLFSRILVPPEVWNEVTIYGAGRPGAHEVSQAAWIEVQAPDAQLVNPLSILLDAGEAEAIALAQTTPDCIILLDDSRARRIATRLGIRQIGTVGLLLRAKRRNLINVIRPHLELLQTNGIYIRQELIDAVLQEAGE